MHEASLDVRRGLICFLMSSLGWLILKIYEDISQINGAVKWQEQRSEETETLRSLAIASDPGGWVMILLFGEYERRSRVGH